MTHFHRNIAAINSTQNCEIKYSCNAIEKIATSFVTNFNNFKCHILKEDILRKMMYHACFMNKFHTKRQLTFILHNAKLFTFLGISLSYSCS